ncbi:MAG: dATP/dGTP diphosphohydrolase domain-containing protein [Acidobacteriaceae bacterium]
MKFGKHLPTDAADRKKIPLFSGLLRYFPDALVAVAHLSYVGNEQHNPGQPLHWAREKSTDQEDTLLRHLLERGTIDSDGVPHSAKVAWRALAMLQLEIEATRAAANPNPRAR